MGMSVMKEGRRAGLLDVEEFCDEGCGFFFQAEDGIRDLVRSRGLGDVYKRQVIRIFKLKLCQHI